MGVGVWEGTRDESIRGREGLCKTCQSELNTRHEAEQEGGHTGNEHGAGAERATGT